MARYQLGDRAGALAAWQRAVELDGRALDALLNLGLVAAGEGRPALAREALRRFLATAPPRGHQADRERARRLLAALDRRSAP